MILSKQLIKYNLEMLVRPKYLKKISIYSISQIYK